jgi:hypothetical protein
MMHDKDFWPLKSYVRGFPNMVTNLDSMPPSSDTDDFRRILSGSHNIVVIAGAGLSAGSGEISSD